MNHVIGQARNGATVSVDLIQSEAAKRISRQPYLLGLVREVIAQTALKGDELTLAKDMGRAIGYDFIVPTTDTSKVFYAKITRDDVYSRFVRERKPSSTQFLTLSLRRRAPNDYELLGVWAGELGPPRPGSANETVDSRPFWAHHAYLLDTESLQSQTITKECPY
jgi:hypothetical protein